MGVCSGGSGLFAEPRAPPFAAAAAGMGMPDSDPRKGSGLSQGQDGTGGGKNFTATQDHVKK